jgi:uncharacterized protein (DUF1501 family)
MTVSRRTFLSTAAASAAAPVRVAIGRDRTAGDILIVLFLRFGADGLTMLPPTEDGAYHDARPTLAIGSQRALPIGRLDGVPFAMHPELPELKALYDAGHLAVVQATGLLSDNRSHFVAQDMMERGVADGDGPVSTGWLSRHLLARRLALTPLGAVTSAANVDLVLQGFAGSVAVPDVSRFNVFGGDANLRVIERMQEGIEPHVAAAREAVATIRSVQAGLRALPVESNPAPYTEGPLSQSLRSVANLIKMDVGLEVAAVDYFGWDHHVNQAIIFPSQAQELSRSLAAFWSDMAAYRHRLTVVTMTEFGRRVQENANAGTDHGAASFMFVLGGAVNGGRLYGTWPGLRPVDLAAGDVRVTTDYRRVLSEILVRRRGETTPEAVFPGVATTPLGIVRPV